MGKHTGPGVHDERRPQFCYQEHAAIETILQTFDGRERQATLAVYQVLTYAASCQYRNGGRDGFAKSATELAAMAGMKAPKFREHARELQKLGLVTATRRTSEAGHDLTTEWTLRSTTGSPGGDPRWSPNESNGDHPTRARENRSREVEPSAKAEGARSARAREARFNTHPPQLRYGGDPVPRRVTVQALDALAHYRARTGQAVPDFKGDGKPSESLKRVLGAMLSYPSERPEKWIELINGVLDHPWFDGQPSVGAVFGPAVIEQNLINPARGRQNGNQNGVKLTASEQSWKRKEERMRARMAKIEAAEAAARER